MTAADPRILAARDRAEREARQIALDEIRRNYGVDPEAAERILAASLAAPHPKKPVRCRFGRHRYTTPHTLMVAGEGVVLSEHHGPLATPAFRVVAMTCTRCPTVHFDIARGA